MPKPLKFHQTLNQAPRSMGHGQHRRAGAPSHSRASNRTSNRARRADAGLASLISWDFAAPEPKPPAIPYAGIRTGELIGHRLWWLIGGKLSSLAHLRFWEPDETVSGQTNEIVASDPWNYWMVWGGTYAFKTRQQIGDDSGDWIEHMKVCAPSHIYFGRTFVTASAIVVGTIKMWGDVIEHTRGYRAEFAKINSIDELHGDGDIEALRVAYMGNLQWLNPSSSTAM